MQCIEVFDLSLDGGEVGHGDFEFLILNFGCWIDELVEVVESGESSYSICSVGRSGSVGSGGIG
jgi:hypothetical protein